MKTDRQTERDRQTSRHTYGEIESERERETERETPWRVQIDRYLRDRGLRGRSCGWHAV